jgi:hypothetical protein
MRPVHRLRFLLASSMLALLAACGGNGDDLAATPPPPAGALPNDSARQAAFATDYSSGLASLNTYGSLTNSAFLDNFDDGFLDAGYTKPMVRDALAKEAAAQLLFAAELSSFPAAKLSAVTINNCDAANVCTLTATLTNTDVDTTSVIFTSRMSFTGGKFRLLGDQKQT